MLNSQIAGASYPLVAPRGPAPTLPPTLGPTLSLGNAYSTDNFSLSRVRSAVLASNSAHNLATNSAHNLATSSAHNLATNSAHNLPKSHIHPLPVSHTHNPPHLANGRLDRPPLPPPPPPVNHRPDHAHLYAVSAHNTMSGQHAGVWNNPSSMLSSNPINQDGWRYNNYFLLIKYSIIINFKIPIIV